MDANQHAQSAENQLPPAVRPSVERTPITFKMSPESPQTASVSQEANNLLEQEVVSTLRNVYHQIDQHFSELYEQNDLNEARVEILKILAKFHPQGCTQVELAQSLEQSEANISAMVTRMRRDGWIYRLRSQVDRRKSNLLLTTKSLEKLASLESSAAELYQQLFQSLSLEETMQLSRDLTKLHLGLTPPGLVQPLKPALPSKTHPATYLQSAELPPDQQRPVA